MIHKPVFAGASSWLGQTANGTTLRRFREIEGELLTEDEAILERIHQCFARQGP